MDAEFYIMIRTNNFSNLLQKIDGKDQKKFALTLNDAGFLVS